MKRLIAAASAAALVFAAVPASAQSEPVKIAHVYGKTGALEAYGKQSHIGLMMALEYATAGTMEIAALVMVDNITLSGAVFGFFLPALIGNVIGGTVLFAFISYGQVYQEI